MDDHCVKGSCRGDDTCLVLSAPQLLQALDKAPLGDLGESAFHELFVSQTVSAGWSVGNRKVVGFKIVETTLGVRIDTKWDQLWASMAHPLLHRFDMFRSRPEAFLWCHRHHHLHQERTWRPVIPVMAGLELRMTRKSFGSQTLNVNIPQYPSISRILVCYFQRWEKLKHQTRPYRTMCDFRRTIKPLCEGLGWHTWTRPGDTQNFSQCQVRIFWTCLIHFDTFCIDSASLWSSPKILRLVILYCGNVKPHHPDSAQVTKDHDKHDLLEDLEDTGRDQGCLMLLNVA